MAGQKENRLQKIAALMLDVNSGEKGKVIEALGGLKQYGDVSIIAPLLTLIFDTEDRVIHQQLHEFLSDVHHKDAPLEFMQALKNREVESEKQLILNILWNSKLNFSDYLPDFINIAVNGDFMTALECLTILENLEGPFKEEDVIEAQIAISHYKDHPSKNEQKNQIMSDMALWLKDLESNLEG